MAPSDGADPMEDAALSLVLAEVIRAGELFGPQDEVTDGGWLAILVEEIGEAAADLNDRALLRLNERVAAERLASEVVQVAAVAVRWLAAMSRRHG